MLVRKIRKRKKNVLIDIVASAGTRLVEKSEVDMCVKTINTVIRKIF